MTATFITHKHSNTSSSGLFTRFVAHMTRHMMRRRSHAAMSSLDDRMLRDIGLSRADVERMVQRG